MGLAKIRIEDEQEAVKKELYTFKEVGVF